MLLLQNGRDETMQPINLYKKESYMARNQLDCEQSLFSWKTKWISKHLYLKKAGLASRNIVLNILRCVSLAVVFASSPFFIFQLAD